MTVDIKLPNINGKTTAEQMSQMTRYMYQMVEQLNWALNHLSSVEETSGTSTVAISKSDSAPSSEKSPQATFNDIKSLIIKSADIVTAYEKIMKEGFDKAYLAASAYGTFESYVDAEITKSAEGIREDFSETQKIVSDNEQYIKDVRACIKSGRLYETVDDNGNPLPIYGIEVGQWTTDKDGNDAFKLFSRLAADKLSFYDTSGNEVAYISNNTLSITQAKIVDKIVVGNYTIDKSDGLVFRWNGGVASS